MERKIEIEEVIEMIESGIDLNLISFEYDLSPEYINECKKEYQRRIEQARKKVVSSYNNSKDKGAHLKMEMMRKKYKALCSQSIIKEQDKSNTQTDEEKEKIDQSIALIKQKAEDMKNRNPLDNRKTAKEVLGAIREIQQLSMTVEQAEKLKGILSQDVFNNLNKNSEDQIDKTIGITRINIEKKLIEAIDAETNRIDDIDELKALSKRIITNSEKNNQIRMESIKRKIDNKIYRLQQEAYRNNKDQITVSLDIIQIVKGLTEGNLNCQEAIKIIEQKAQRTVESKRQTKFTLTKEQEAKKIVRQIHQILTNNAEKYAISDSQTAIDNLIKLGSETPEIAIRTVVKNFAARGEIEEAKQICDKYKKQSTYYKYMKCLRREIVNEEVKKQVLQYLSADDIQPEEERKLIALLEEKVESGEIVMSAINIGKSRDNLHTVTLEEICRGIIFENER